MQPLRRDGTLRRSAEVALIVRDEMEKHGPNVDLNHIDVSQVTTLVNVFKDTPFNGDISQWNVANVESMEGLFKNCPFNGDISNWNTTSLRVATQMFMNSSFNGDISRWDTSGLIVGAAMFQDLKFNGDISNWNTKQLAVLSCMFQNSAFRGDISKWNLENAFANGHFDRVFDKTAYTGDLSSWRATNLRSLRSMRNALGPDFKGIAPRSAGPISKEFYAELFGTSQRLHKYLRTQEFGGVHFDILRLAQSQPAWCKKADYVWARQLGRLAQSIGMNDDALRDYAMMEYHTRTMPVKPAMVLDIGELGLVEGLVLNSSIQPI